MNKYLPGPEGSQPREEARPISITQGRNATAAESTVNCVVYNLDEQVSPTEAQEILGEESVYGVDRLKRILGQYWYDAVPKIGATREELEIAAKNGKGLVLTLDHFPDNSPVTMERIHEYREKVNAKQDPEKRYRALFYAPQSGRLPLLEDALSGKAPKNRPPKERWYENCQWYTDQTPSLGWALVSDGIMAGTENRNIFERIIVLADDLERTLDLRSGRFPEYQRIIEDFKRNKESLRTTFQALEKQSWDGWDGAWEMLMRMPICRLVLPTPVEVTYANVLGASIFETNECSTWTPTLALSPKHGLVEAGHCEAGLRFDTNYSLKWNETKSRGAMSIIRLNGQIPTPQNGVSMQRLREETQTRIGRLQSDSIYG